MQKILSRLLVPFLIMGLLGCASKGQEGVAYRSSVFERLPFVYKMAVQQGNIVSEERVNSLEPGMSKRQVRFLLGTPLLVDIFHPDRWDYTYTIRRGHEPMELRRLTLLFEGDALASIEGDLQTASNGAGALQEEQVVILEVPDWQDRRGLFRRMAEGVGLDETE